MNSQQKTNLNLDLDSWNTFLSNITKPYTYNESCAWLFCKKPFCEDNIVFIFPVKNIGLNDRSLQESFSPDKSQFAKVKRIAKANHLTRIGNVHTHILAPQNLVNLHPDFLEDSKHPSKTDLFYARKFNDIIRGVVTVVFDNEGDAGKVVSIVWHDQFGNILEVE